MLAQIGTPAMPLITLVDDDQNILTSLKIAFESEGFHVNTYTDGLSALEGLLKHMPDIAIFDIKMPRMDGMALLTQIRQHSDVPVIFLTSKDEDPDELSGLKMGADDYIRKPFSQHLLLARVQAILRRTQERTSSPPGHSGQSAPMGEEPDTDVIHRGALLIDKKRHMCFWNQRPVSLTVTEFLILSALALRPGIVKTRNDLMDIAYDDQIYVDDRTIDSHIKRLRKKFKMVDPEFTMIETLYGVGYRYREG